MSFLLGNDYFIIPLFGICVFLVSYLMSDKILFWLHKKSLGSREEVIEIMDRMLLDIDKSRITLIMLLLSFGLGSIAFVAFWPNVITGLIFGGLVTIGGWSLPKLLVTILWERRCDRLANQFVDGLTIMANGVKAGLSITQSMERVIENMKGPLPQEFNLVLNKIRLGMSVEESLNEFADRIPRPDVQMLVISVNILKETGGNLAETFETIVLTVRDRQKVEQKIQAMTAQGVMQGIIITLVPFVLMVVFMIFDPPYMKPMFSTTLGVIALIIMLALQVIGGVLMKKIVTIKV